MPVLAFLPPPPCPGGGASFSPNACALVGITCMWVWPLATSRNDGPPDCVGAGRSLQAAAKAATTTRARRRFMWALLGTRRWSGLYSARAHGLPQSRQRVPRRNELVGDVPGEPQIRDGCGDAAPVQLLTVVQLVAARHAAGMEVTDPLRVVADRADHVAFHDLHVVDVVQQLD